MSGFIEGKVLRNQPNDATEYLGADTVQAAAAITCSKPVTVKSQCCRSLAQC